VKSAACLFVASLLGFGGTAAADAPRVIAPLPGRAELIETTLHVPARTILLRGVRFSSADFKLRVVDNPGGETHSLGQAMQAIGAIAGTNGGYFHEDFRPLGLVMIAGKTLHDAQRAKLLSGVVASGAKGIDLFRAAEFSPQGVTDALQAGPFLVDGTKPVPGLNATRSARRTVIATDGKRTWFLGNLGPCTLAEAAEALAGSKLFAHFPVRRALNLDGGHSTGLWVDTPGSPLSLGPISKVRNYLAVIPQD
jgi:hypothetical protein